MIQQISKIKKQSREMQRVTGERVTTTEEQYFNDPTSESFRAWIEAQQDYRLTMLRIFFFQKQLAFGEGESVGRMLAHLVKINSPPSIIPAISIGEGSVSSHTPEIVDRFRHYYEDLYSSRQEEIGEEMVNFFGDLTIALRLSPEIRGFKRGRG